MIARNKLRKVLFHGLFLVKFYGYSVRNFKSLEQLFLNQSWVTAFIA